ncbi:uncharacterized protein LOC116165475 isoform X2 [Photinus pyralis]|uniref:uncharacterized protein LOC116165475 isoform X2 n=1 Tax=Photinus pyralis TaxID=7054 RepID=UPI0012677007|nr:uncharacterized protein LOC116165475 isoform X2 [Photinus pyralis]
MKLLRLLSTSSTLFLLGYCHIPEYNNRSNLSNQNRATNLSLYNLVNTAKQYQHDLLNNKISAYTYSFTSTNANNKAQAQASITFGNTGSQNIENSIPTQGFNLRNWRPPRRSLAQKKNTCKVYFGKNEQIALASTAYSENGYQQIAAINPKNPKFPNIYTYGKLSNNHNLAMMAYSQVKNKPVLHEAISQVIRNDKVTTYFVHN